MTYNVFSGTLNPADSLSTYALVLATVNLSITNLKDKTGTPKFKHGSHDLDHGHLGVVCHPESNT